MTLQPLSLALQLSRERNAEVAKSCCLRTKGVDFMGITDFLFPGSITEIFGEAGVGKTQIAFQLASYWTSGNHDSLCNRKTSQTLVFWFDSESSFRPERIENGDLKRILVKRISTPEELLFGIAQLKGLCSEAPILVVVDSLGGLSRGREREIAQNLKELRHVYILVINQVRANIEDNAHLHSCAFKAAGGKKWADQVNQRFFVRKSHDGSREISLL